MTTIHCADIHEAAQIARVLDNATSKSSFFTNNIVFRIWPESTDFSIASVLERQKSMRTFVFSVVRYYEYTLPKNLKTIFSSDSDYGISTCIILDQRAGIVRAAGVARCHPDDVFDADVGQVLALARAIDILKKFNKYDCVEVLEERVLKVI